VLFQECDQYFKRLKSPKYSSIEYYNIDSPVPGIPCDHKISLANRALSSSSTVYLISKERPSTGINCRSFKTFSSAKNIIQMSALGIGKS
jgi:hypothetical protein